MSPGKLDAIFPYVCFFYGAVVSVALNMPKLAEIAEERFPEKLVVQWKAHRGLALTCLLVGAAWILEDIWVA